MEQPAIGILNENRIMSIATIRPDGWPQTTIVGYVNEGFRLYFLIYRASQKFKNISYDNRISIAVGHDPEELSAVKAVYAGCIVHEVTDLRERSHAWTLLAKRHPNLMDLAPPRQGEVATMAADCRYISVLDYSRGLGHTESLTIDLEGEPKTAARKKSHESSRLVERAKDNQNLASVLRFEHDGMGIAPKE